MRVVVREEPAKGERGDNRAELSSWVVRSLPTQRDLTNHKQQPLPPSQLTRPPMNNLRMRWRYAVVNRRRDPSLGEQVPMDVIKLVIEEAKFDLVALRTWTRVSKDARALAIPLLYHTLTIKKEVSTINGRAGSEVWREGESSRGAS